VLTGTDLYQDIEFDAQARQSLEMAHRLVVLQELGGEALPPHLRDKARLVFQSTPARLTLHKPDSHLLTVMVGHLRDVKSPETLFDAARLLGADEGIRIDHIGGADDEWASRARAASAASPHYRWLGAMPYEACRECIQQAHVLVHTSALEGGAHVIMEAVRSGTPVLASRVPGNVGMLGAEYEGYFPHGDVVALARLLRECRASQRSKDPGATLLARLRTQCTLRAPLFDEANERAALLQLLQELDPS